MVSYFSYFYMLLRNFLNPTVLWRFTWINLRRYVKFKISGTASPCPACPPPPCWAPSAPTAPRWARSARATTRGDTESIEKETSLFNLWTQSKKWVAQMQRKCFLFYKCVEIQCLQEMPWRRKCFILYNQTRNECGETVKRTRRRSEDQYHIICKTAI